MFRYNKGTIPGSINIPFHSAFSPEGDLNPCPAVTTLNNHQQQVKVIAGGRNRNAVNVSLYEKYLLNGLFIKASC